MRPFKDTYKKEMYELDVRGYSRGIPVFRTQKAIKEHPGESLVVLVDTGWSREDISRLALKMGYSVSVENVGQDCKLVLNPIKDGS
jgi:TusA-related sulfurtransferase